ncbi:MAG: hypothetical protein U0694_20355 [Anaerolineae bacterium]
MSPKAKSPRRSGRHMIVERDGFARREHDRMRETFADEQRRRFVAQREFQRAAGARECGLRVILFSARPARVCHRVRV